ncbi:tripartite tricarboxylate transporter TctB family protein [Rhizobiaceae bacterium BDR2-2]|uniref:Tripartite tricarboxylate transporter TctB family protein n=1 Tax=Ectorhizobium quercum TaxID=2965071 RepID=A0AAE3MVB0_9HYPH|nr:tripartite tricarboxylate transporter TctB family protein [Ectorhizobium quercum]MCX8995539.1 tripartite tricarboxylate transporter TctB family protein [Ectorhizobium quercum]
MVDGQGGEADISHRPLGLFLIVAGLVALWIARDYDIGTFISMGPGFFPVAVSGCLVVFGVLVLLMSGRDLPEGERRAGTPVPFLHRLRVLAAIAGAIVLFGLTLRSLGLPVAAFLLVFVAGLARPVEHPLVAIATAAVLSAFTTLLFVVLLKLNIPILPEFLR